MTDGGGRLSELADDSVSLGRSCNSLARQNTGFLGPFQGTPRWLDGLYALRFVSLRTPSHQGLLLAVRQSKPSLTGSTPRKDGPGHRGWSPTFPVPTVPTRSLSLHPTWSALYPYNSCIASSPETCIADRPRYPRGPFRLHLARLPLSSTHMQCVRRSCYSKGPQNGPSYVGSQWAARIVSLCRHWRYLALNNCAVDVRSSPSIGRGVYFAVLSCHLAIVRI